MKNILVVHKDMGVRLVIRAVLEGAGYRVLLADELHSGFGDLVSWFGMPDLAIIGRRSSREAQAIQPGVRVMPLPVRIEDGIIRIESGFLEDVQWMLAEMPARIAAAAMG